MSEDINIWEYPNCNTSFSHYNRVDGRLQETSVARGCLNRWELTINWGMPIDEINRANLHASLDEWLNAREKIMAE